MSGYSELIKSFSKSREYVRDFFVYGFKSRDEFTQASARTYDNEKRHVEDWFSEYVRSDYADNGKNISLSINSALCDTNPLYNVFKSKSYTENDILLHFMIIDYLSCNPYKTADEITDGIISCSGEFFDVQMVRRKCNEYEKDGLLKREKSGNRIVYYIDDKLRAYFERYSFLKEAVAFFSVAAPEGFAGDTILDNICAVNDVFRIKHAFFVNALEDEMLLQILTAMHEGRSIITELKSSRDGHEMKKHIVPLKIFASTRSGRRYLCGYPTSSNRFTCIRLDSVKSVRVLDIYGDYDFLAGKLEDNLHLVFGVSFDCQKHMHSNFIKLTLKIDEKNEQFIINRLEREGRGGIIKRVTQNTFTYEKEVFDAAELCPWIRTFTGRIIDIETNHPAIRGRILHDFSRMYKMYDI